MKTDYQPTTIAEWVEFLGNHSDQKSWERGPWQAFLVALARDVEKDPECSEWFRKAAQRVAEIALEAWGAKSTEHGARR